MESTLLRWFSSSPPMPLISLAKSLTEAPMSVYLTSARVTFLGCSISVSKSSRGSGTLVIPIWEAKASRW